MDQNSNRSTIVCQDQETQHKEEEKANVTEAGKLDKKDSNTDQQSKDSSASYQDQETQHTEEEKESFTEHVSVEKNSNSERQRSTESIKLQDHETQLNGIDNLDVVMGIKSTCEEQETKHKIEKGATNAVTAPNLDKPQSYTIQQTKSNPIPSHDQENQRIREGQRELIKETTSRLEMLREIAIKSIDLNVATCSTASSLQTSSVSNNSCVISSQPRKYKEYDPRLPVIVINSPTNRSPITIQPSRTFLTIQSSISPKSFITVLPNQPQSLFLQALSKLNASSLSLAILNDNFQSKPTETEDGTELRSPELTPPDSLTSAPPSYSFVLRQSAARRRPRLMGTFIPSPSFVTKTPPPNYAAAFDIYVDSPLPPQPTRIYHFGFSAMPIVCPECGYVGLTTVTSRVTLCTHLCALLLCLFCCWLCAPMPYVMSSCKDVYHYCRNCRNFLGMYSPSNPETPYPV